MPDAGYLTIGKVVKRLQGQYPDLSISKVRYLEDEGLLNPSRTPSGYRLYSQKDVHRLETILYLQKNRFMPLSVIKQQLDGGEGHVSLAQTPYPNIGEDDEEVLQKFHPIDRMPELLGVPVSFVRQLSEAGVIQLRESPHGRSLVDGKDFQLISSEYRQLQAELNVTGRQLSLFGISLSAVRAGRTVAAIAIKSPIAGT
ncbi:MerR family transcriptional regulator, partial [Parafannyhessea umbonata]|uniref:MerR family transcriptional regulator n=1 Tax=Parafannyhessea umbonata TaxID=604330 RepID=UPI002A7F7793